MNAKETEQTGTHPQAGQDDTNGRQHGTKTDSGVERTTGNRDGVDDDPMTRGTHRERISIGSPCIGKREKETVAELLASDALVSEKHVTKFEAEFASFCTADAGVATASGGTALRAGLAALDIGDGDVVLTTALTSVGTAHAIRMAGVDVAFADIDPETYNIDPASVETTLHERNGEVDAIHVCHHHGLPAEMRRLREIADRYEIPLIEEASQALGGTYRGQSVGSFGDIGWFSLSPTKNMTTGQGGMLVTDRERLADRARRFVDPDRDGRPGQTQCGQSSRLSELAAALGRVQLDRLPAFVGTRRQHARHLREELTETSFECQSPPEEARHAYQRFTVRARRRDELREHLDEFGIDTNLCHPAPVYEHPDLQEPAASTPRAERVTGELLSVPIHPKLSRRDIDAIVTGLEYFDSYL